MQNLIFKKALWKELVSVGKTVALTTLTKPKKYTVQLALCLGFILLQMYVNEKHLKPYY